MDSRAEKFYEFGKFRLDAERCVLFDENNAVVDATPKALEILCILIESGGRVVSKEEIIRQVWPQSFVEEANLSHHIFRLRKALGESEESKFIETLPKRGYRFIASFSRAAASGFKDTHLITEENRTVPNERKRTSRNRMMWTALMVALLLILSGAAIAWLNMRKIEGGEQNQRSRPQIQTPMTIVRITNGGKYGAASISPDGKFIAYAQNFTVGEGMLYIRQTETNTEAQLLEPDERIFGATAFSPDGAYVYYIVYDKRDPEGALYRISVVGGQPTRLLGNVKIMFTLSSDGKRVTFFRDEPEQKQKSLIVAALDGSGERKVLTRNYDEMDFSFCPAFSPDGKHIAFGAIEKPAQNEEKSAPIGLFEVEIASGFVKKISNELLVDMGMMNWMPDGSGLVLIGEQGRTGNQIYFLSYPSGKLHRITRELNVYGNYGMGITADGTTMVADLFESTAQLWSIDARGLTTNAEQLTSGTSDGSRGLATLDDGRIVYAARTGDDFDLWMLSEKAGKREGVALTSDAFSEGEVCSTPDNRFLIFASDRAGNQHLFQMGIDGSNITQVTFGESFDSAPSCSPDGQFVAYASTVNNQTTIWKVPVDGGVPARLTNFECAAPSFSPNGKLLACIIPVESVVRTATLAIVPADGGEPLRTFDVLPFGWYYRAACWTPDGNALVFPKTEKSVGNLWKQNLVGGPPKQFTDFNSDLIFNCAFSHHNNQLIVSRGKYAGNTIELKNFKPFDSN